MSHMKVANALYRSKDITNHSNNPCLILNIIF